MKKNSGLLSRRAFVGASALFACGAGTAAIAQERMQAKAVPATDETIPVIGLGTYDVFDVGGNDEELALRRSIVEELYSAGGKVIDTSPMYNRSERIIGEVLASGDLRDSAFIATKVWTDGRDSGSRQMRRSAELMGVSQIDLMQVHNRRDLDAHWPTIQSMKDEGFIRYDGITDYRESAHGAMMRLMRDYRPDFIQINYSLGERGADRELLPLARELGIAVLINRPFVAGRLFRAVGDRPLPGWAGEFANSWGQFFLKYIVSHAAVTCAIPATSKLHHMVDNAGAGSGPMPDAATRQRMERFVDDL